MRKGVGLDVAGNALTRKQRAKRIERQIYYLRSVEETIDKLTKRKARIINSIGILQRRQNMGSFILDLHG